MASVYFYNAINGNITQRMDEDSAYYLTRLLNFRNEIQLGKITRDDFSEKLLGVIRNHKSFSKVTRVCLTLHSPLSHRLEVLNSHYIDQEKNNMKSGYTCFVSPDSSLNQLKQGDTRTFSKIDDILNSFNNSGKPIQRSLFYLDRMGVRSGITIALKFGEIKGYLFLNSEQEDYFDNLIKEEASYFNLLEMIASEFFSEEVTKLMRISNIDEYIEKFPKEVINSNLHLKTDCGVEKVSSLIGHYLNQNSIPLTIVDKSSIRSLVPWGQVTLLCSILLKEIGYDGQESIEMEIFEEGEEMKISISSERLQKQIGKVPYDHFRALRRFSKGIGLDLVAVKNNLYISVPLDGEIHEEMGYSVG